jgi:hypothetical protein
MTDDITILTSEDGLKAVTTRTKGLKSVNKALSEQEKELIKLDTQLDKEFSRSGRTKYSHLIKALISTGASKRQIMKTIGGLSQSPPHAAYSFLAARGASQQTLNAILRNSPPAAAAHIRGQLSYQQSQTPIGATSRVPYTPGMPNQNLAMMNQYTQQGINFGIGQGPAAVQPGFASNLKQMGGDFARALTVATTAVAGFTAGVSTVMNTVRGGEDARVGLDKQKNSAGRTIAQTAATLGIRRDLLENAFSQGGAGALSVMDSAFNLGVGTGSKGQAGSLLMRGLEAGRRTGRYDLASQMVGERSTAGLNRLLRVPMTQENENLKEYNAIDAYALQIRAKEASPTDKASQMARRLREAGNTDTENLLGVVGLNAYQELLIQEQLSDAGTQSNNRHLSGGQVNGRSGGTRAPSFDTVQGRGQQVKNLTVEHMTTSPTINPYPSR